MSGNNNTNTENATATQIVNTAAYQTAQGLAGAAQNMFNDIKTKAPVNITTTISKLDEGFANLKKSIDSKAPNDNITSIIHGTILTNLQTAFDLQVVPEFPLPLLLIIPAIGAIIAVTRINTKNK